MTRRATYSRSQMRWWVPSARAIAPFEGHGIPRERFTVVENGVDTTALESLPIPEPTGRPLRIGFLGTLIPSKGLDVLVQAVQRLPAGSASLRIHGNAVPYHGDDGFLTRVFSGLQPKMTFTTRVPTALRSASVAGVDRRSRRAGALA